MYFRIKKKNLIGLGGFGPMESWQEHVFLLIIWRHHPIPRANILARSLVGFYGRIRVFRALDWVSSVSGSKVRPKKQLIGKGLFSILFGDFPNYFKFSCPYFATRNAKTCSDPSKSRIVTKKQLNSKKIDVIWMAPAGLKGRSGKNADVSKNNINILSLYNH